jgi:hypothetical protein
MPINYRPQVNPLLTRLGIDPAANADATSLASPLGMATAGPAALKTFLGPREAKVFTTAEEIPQMNVILEWMKRLPLSRWADDDVLKATRQWRGQ